MNINPGFQNDNSDDTVELDARMSLITDVNRQVPIDQLPPEDQIDAQTFDMLKTLIQDSILLRKIEWSIPSESPQSAFPESLSEKPLTEERHSRKYSFRVISAILSTATALVVFALIAINYIIPQSNNSDYINAVAESSDEESTPQPLNESNYWESNFEDQLSDFEGEMICLSVGSEEFSASLNDAYINMEDISELGEF